jgi:hypothetical protein
VSSNQAAQQIANLLVQAGTPPGHALDVAQRLLTMSNNGPAANRGPKTVTSSQANNPQFFNRFKTDEQNARDGEAGTAGKDGLPGYGGTGVDGRDGIPGAPGNPGEVNWDNIRDMIASMIQEALSGFLANLLNTVLSCTWFTKKFRDCIDAQPGGGGGLGCPKCCNRSSLKELSGQDICSILLAWRPEIVKVKDLEKRIKAIEKDLNNTTDCEA